jgi:hypothetical protein
LGRRLLRIGICMGLAFVVWGIMGLVVAGMRAGGR